MSETETEMGWDGMHGMHRFRRLIEGIFLFPISALGGIFEEKESDRCIRSDQTRHIP